MYPINEIPNDLIDQQENLPEHFPENDDALLFDLNPPPPPEPEPIEEFPPNFHENLAESMDDASLSSLSGRLMDLIEQDRESRSEWESKTKSALEYLGTNIEQFRNTPFLYACSAYDTTMLSALLKSYAVTKGEMFPSSGPVRTTILGYSTPELETSAANIKDGMNYYLTVVDTPYYPNSDKLILYRNFFGSAFRKVWQDPISGHPIARLVTPQDLIVYNEADCLTDSDRITQYYELSRREVILRQVNGVFKNISLPGEEDNTNLEDNTNSEINTTIKRLEGIDTASNEKKTILSFYECHTNLTELDFGRKVPNDKNVKDIPCPYIITICIGNKKIVSIRRNWKENDNTYKKQTYFVHYQYLPGFGIYSLGLAHIIGSNSIALTSMIRQLIDSGSLSAFPGFLIEKGLRTAKNNKTPSPGEGVEIDTGGRPLSEVVMPFPYKEPSVVINQLRKDVIEETLQASGSAELPIGENMANTPAATTMASIEVANRLQTATLKSFHISLSQELQLLYDLFRQNISGPMVAKTPGSQTVITPQDFHEDIRVYPVSEDNVSTQTQRLIMNETVLRLASQNPQLHDMRQIYYRIYSTLRIPDIEKILPIQPEPISLDPITENMHMIQGKPAKVMPYQAHDAHMATHSPLLQDPNISQQAKMIIMAHIAEHVAEKYKLQMQQMMGVEMPPAQMLQDPQIQNHIAMLSMSASQQLGAQLSEGNPKPLDPNKAMMMDVEQRREAAHLKSDEAKLRAETESFKSTLKYDSEMERYKTQKEIAERKNASDLAIEEIKHDEEKKSGIWNFLTGGKIK